MERNVRERMVLSVTILETTKTGNHANATDDLFYRSQFWRLQKLEPLYWSSVTGFIGHNFGDYKNQPQRWRLLR